MAHGIKAGFEQIVVMTHGIITSFEQIVVMTHDWDALYGNTFDDLPEDVDLSEPTFFLPIIFLGMVMEILCDIGGTAHFLPHTRSLRFEKEIQGYCMLLQNQRLPWEQFWIGCLMELKLLLFMTRKLKISVP